MNRCDGASDAELQAVQLISTPNANKTLILYMLQGSEARYGQNSSRRFRHIDGVQEKFNGRIFLAFPWVKRMAENNQMWREFGREADIGIGYFG